MNFFDSDICACGHYCEACRNSRGWRAGVKRLYDDLGVVDFACPTKGIPPESSVPEVPKRLLKMQAAELVVEMRKQSADDEGNRLIEYALSEQWNSPACTGCARSGHEARMRLWLVHKEAEHGA